MGLLSKIFGAGPFGSKSTLDTLGVEELRVMEIKLNRKIDALHDEIRGLDTEIAALFERSKSIASQSEKTSLARKIKTVSQKKEMKISAQAQLDKELRGVSNLLILKENEADLKAAGVWERLKQLSPDDLETYLSAKSLEAEDRNDLITDVINMTSIAMQTGVEHEDDLEEILTAMDAVRSEGLDPEEAARKIEEKELE
jgi:rRNA maturation endonuclease Nob1